MKLVKIEEIRDYLLQERILAKVGGEWYVCFPIGEVVPEGEGIIEHYYRVVKKVTWKVDFNYKGHQPLDRHDYDVDYMVC